jgi:hypothetical protein
MTSNTATTVRLVLDPTVNQPFESIEAPDPAPTMMRAYHDSRIGTTAFFRNRPFLRLLVSELRRRCKGRPRILFHACSIGAEPYSLALWWSNRVGTRPPLICATDADSAFLDIARRGEYPASIVDGMTAEERSWLDVLPNGNVRVPDRVRRIVRFLPPRSFLEPMSQGQFDAVLVMNALTYVAPDEQSVAIARAATAARSLLGLTAFHPDSIRHDLERVGFVPVLDRQREIHEAWGVRCVSTPPSPNTPEYAWQLPSFDTPVADRDFRFCALFASAGAMRVPSERPIRNQCTGR